MLIKFIWAKPYRLQDGWMYSCFGITTFLISILYLQQNYQSIIRINSVLMSAAILLSDASMWYIIYCYYHSIRLMNKLREIATVAIPCPPPGSVPFHFRRENMYIGSNGYKHILSEAPDGNY